MKRTLQIVTVVCAVVVVVIVAQYYFARNVPLPLQKVNSADGSRLAQSNSRRGQNKLPQSTLQRRMLLASVLVEQMIKNEDVTREQALELVRQLRELGESATPTIRELLGSKEEVRRVLGTYLFLEVQGQTDELLRLAHDDQSGYLRAEVARWLFLSGDFQRWEDFMRQEAVSITSYQLQNFLNSFDQDPPQLETTSAMRALNLGTALPEYLSRIASMNSEIFDTVRTQTVNRELSANRRQGLLQVLNSANESAARSTLEVLITNQNDDLNVRWQAIRLFANAANRIEERDFLQNIPILETDPLQKAITNAIAEVNTRFQTGGVELRTAEDKVRQALLDSSSSPMEVQAAVDSYVQALSYHSPSEWNNDVLRVTIDFMENHLDVNDIHAELAARASYQLWKKTTAP